MAIPEYPGLMQPVLRVLTDTKRDMRFGPLMRSVGARMGLTPEEIARRLPSGRETVFSNRLHWALAYLERSGAVQVRQGHYRPVGEAEVADAGASPGRRLPAKGAAATPSDRVAAVAAGAGRVRQRLARGLLERIHTEPPEFFERLVIALLLAMGYGCGHDVGRHLGRRGDGGIDGAVPQDVLGLDVVYIQAKRYHPDSTVPVSAVREFAGSLDGCKARKGIFVTTAAFSRSAARFVSMVPSNIVLIDGTALADLLIGYNIGLKARDLSR